MDTSHADSPISERSPCWCLHTQMLLFVLQLQQSPSFPPLQQQPDPSNTSPHGCASQADRPCSALLGMHWLGESTHPREWGPPANSHHLVWSLPCKQSSRSQALWVSTGAAPKQDCHASTAQFGHRWKPWRNKHSGAAPESLSYVEGEAWTASFQTGDTGKSPVNYFGLSCPHLKSCRSAELLSGPEQKCFHQFEKE